MLSSEISLPVRIPNVYQGLAEAVGILHATAAGLHIELEVKEAFFHTMKLGGHELVIQLQDLALIELKLGWFNTWIILRTNNLKALRNISGADGCELRLKVARRDRAIAAELVSSIAMYLQGHQVQKMIQSLEPPLNP